ncbi:MAG: type II toxin-antitoxin system VapC family toxin [Steroidobacter sp.]
MIALDTNMLVRLYVDDGDRQSEKQRAIVVKVLSAAGELFVAKTVMLELEWVLRGYYKFDREQIANAFTHLLGLENIVIEDESVVTEAVTHYRKGLDFADSMHCASSSHSKRMLTFDRKFVTRAKRSGVKLAISVPDQASVF